ncbi:MAG: transglycosylase domain-containing protein [Verrucomicrobiota bacterium]
MPTFWKQRLSFLSAHSGGSGLSAYLKRPLILVPALFVGSILLLVLAVCAYYGLWALRFDMERVSRMPATSIIYDRNGYVIQRLYDEHRILVGTEDIPEVLKHAFLSKEDSRFYWHPGVDPIAVVRSLLINIFSGEVQTGASTITQQLARNSAGIFQRTIDRKLKEMFLAVRIEIAFSKDEILGFYLNRIFFGGNINGIGAASEAYFGKHPRDLNLEESALLAGIVAAPNAFTPWKNPKKTREVRAFTLDRMVDQKFISREQADLAKKQPLKLRPLIDLPGTYVTSVVRDMLPTFVNKEILFRGGLHIHTTIDLAFQKAATLKLQEGLTRLENTQRFPHPTRAAYLRTNPDFSRQPPYVQGAFVALSNVDGGIMAIVGGRHFDESTFNRALLSERQIGSTIKPFVYAHAFNVLNCTAFTEVDKSAFPLQTVGPQLPLAGDSPEFISIRQALQTSNNYAAMRLGMASGVDSFSYFMSQLTDRSIAPFPSTFLGACALSPIDLASAFSIFPNYGVALEPYLIRRINLHDGRLLFEQIDERRRVISPQVAYQIHDILAGVVSKGTGRLLRSKYKLQNGLGGKTGTTNDYKDSWFAGYTSEITSALWVGFDQPKSIMPAGYASRVAVPIWGEIMKLANDAYPPKEFYPPPGVQKVQQKKESTFLWIFKTESVGGPAEYVRDDQRGSAMARLDDSYVPEVFVPEEKSVMRRAWEWVFPPEQKDVFKETGEETERAIIHDTFETEAPKAAPVDASKK